MALSLMSSLLTITAYPFLAWPFPCLKYHALYDICAKKAQKKRSDKWIELRFPWVVECYFWFLNFVPEGLSCPSILETRGRGASFLYKFNFFCNSERRQFQMPTKNSTSNHNKRTERNTRHTPRSNTHTNTHAHTQPQI